MGRPLLSSSSFVSHLSLLRESGLVDEALAASSEVLAKQNEVVVPFIAIEHIRSLLRAGATREALARLKRGRWTADVQASTAYQMAIINSLVVQWRYEDALPVIENLLRSEQNGSTLTRLTNSEHLLLLVTRTAALVFMGKLGEAAASWDNLYSELIASDALVLARRYLEIGAQMHWEKNHPEALRSLLGQAKEFFAKFPHLAGSHADFFLERWAVMSEIMLTETAEPQRASFSERIAEIRQRATDLGDFEAIRDADLFAVQVLGDKDKLVRLYYMTPFASFRSYLDRLCKRIGIEVPDSASIEVGAKANTRVSFSITSGHFSTGASFRPGGMSYRVMSSLLRDGYRPLRTAELFHEIHPDEVYDSVASARRVQQAVRRFKQEIEELGVPLRLNSMVGGYGIVEDGTGIDLQISAAWLALDDIDRSVAPDMYVLKQSFGTSAFTISEASRRLGKPIRSTQLLLRKTVELDYVTRRGDGRASRYQLA